MVQSIFNIVLTKSITGGVLVLIVNSIKPILARKNNYLLQHHIWVAVVMWLLIPYLLKIPSINGCENNNITAITDAISSQQELTYQESSYNISKLISHVNSIRSNLTSIPLYSKLKQLLPNIWLIGVLVFAASNIYQYIFLKLYLEQNSSSMDKLDVVTIFEECKMKMNIKRNILLRVTTKISTPILSGILKPIITLPDIDFKYEEYKLIFIHELTHYKRRDILCKIVTLTVNIIHWFNPFAYSIAKNISDTCEFACDEAVVCDMSNYERKCYGETILNIIALYTNNKKIFSTTLCGNIKKIEDRLNLIMNYSRSKKGIPFLSTVFILFFMVAGFSASSVLGNILHKNLISDSLTNNNVKLSEEICSIVNNKEAEELDTFHNNKENDTIVLSVDSDVIITDDYIFVRGDENYKILVEQGLLRPIPNNFPNNINR